MTNQVLHIDLISLKPATQPSAINDLIAAASALLSLDEVVSGGVIQSEINSHVDLAVLFALKDFAALEPFGTHSGYTRFLQGKVAPLLKAFSGADIAIDKPLEMGKLGYGTCLALAASDEVYDWEIRQQLEQWRDGVAGTASVLGLVVGERQRYRGFAASFSTTALKPSQRKKDKFETALVTGRTKSLA